MDASPASLPLSVFTGSAAGSATLLARTTRAGRCCRCCCAGLKACRAEPRQNVLHAACIWWPLLLLPLLGLLVHHSRSLGKLC